MKRLGCVAALLLAGCSTFNAPRYYSSADNVVALRSLPAPINIGAFTPAAGDEISCPLIGPIKAADGEPFSSLVRKALVDELQMAGNYAPASRVTITGNLDSFATAPRMPNPAWDMALTLRSSNGTTLTVTERFAFEVNFIGSDACHQAANSLIPAVQNLVGKAVRSPDFLRLATP